MHADKRRCCNAGSDYLEKLEPRQPNIHTSLLAVARSGIGYEIFNEAVDSGYILFRMVGGN